MYKINIELFTKQKIIKMKPNSDNLKISEDFFLTNYRIGINQQKVILCMIKFDYHVALS